MTGMEWHNLHNDERLRLWKKLRASISADLLDSQLESIAKFFESVPYSTRTLDYYDPASWPTPWEILFNGSFCKSSISILIFHTLKMLHTDHHITLQLIDDGTDEYLVPVIDDQFVLNYQLGSVNNYSTLRLECIHKLTFDESQIKLTV